MSTYTGNAGLTKFFSGTAMMQANAVRGAARGSLVPATPSQRVFWKAYTDPGATPGATNETSEMRLESTKLALYWILVYIGNSTADWVAEQTITSSSDSSWMTWIGTLALTQFKIVIADSGMSAAAQDMRTPTATKLYKLWVDVSMMGAAQDAAKAAQAADLTTGAGSTSAGPLVWRPRAVASSVLEIMKELKLPGCAKDSDFNATKCQTFFENIGDMGQPNSQASYLALVLYLCGRPASGKYASISTKRPENLQAKFNNKQVWAEIGGPLKLSEGAIKYIGRAWEIDPLFRRTFFMPFVVTATYPGGILDNIIGTMVSLLHMAQLSHVVLIQEFVKTYPWVFDIPELASEFATIIIDMERYLAYPIEEQPFAKLLYRDAFKAFDSKKLSRLTKLAVDVMSQNAISLNDYAVKGADPLVRAAFDARLGLVASAPTPATPADAPTTS
jgi:hypothetical protein